MASKCEMIPIERVCRIATVSFLRRYLGVKKEYKFYPLRVEMFFKDHANNGPQWSEKQLIAAKLCFAGLVTSQTEADIVSHATQANFEMLEESWLHQDCTLVDTKAEFGIDVTTKKKLFLPMLLIMIPVDAGHQEIKANRKTVVT